MLLSDRLRFDERHRRRRAVDDEFVTRSGPARAANAERDFGLGGEGFRGAAQFASKRDQVFSQSADWQPFGFREVVDLALGTTELGGDLGRSDQEVIGELDVLVFGDLLHGVILCEQVTRHKDQSEIAEKNRVCDLPAISAP
jgi:hypothetical protein